MGSGVLRMKWSRLLLCVSVALLLCPQNGSGVEILSEEPSGAPSSVPLRAPPHEVENVALADFGIRIGAGDYGMANIEPIEVGNNIGQGDRIRILRTPTRLGLSRRGIAAFQAKVGETKYVYFWIESPPVGGSWHLKLTMIHSDGFREVVFNEDMLRQTQYFAWVNPWTILDFKITSLERKRELNKRFTFTVSPVSITVWKGLMPLPYRIERYYGH